MVVNLLYCYLVNNVPCLKPAKLTWTAMHTNLLGAGEYVWVFIDVELI